MRLHDHLGHVCFICGANAPIPLRRQHLRHPLFPLRASRHLETTSESIYLQPFLLSHEKLKINIALHVRYMCPLQATQNDGTASHSKPTGCPSSRDVPGTDESQVDQRGIRALRGRYRRGTGLFQRSERPRTGTRDNEHRLRTKPSWSLFCLVLAFQPSWCKRLWYFNVSSC